MSDRLTLYNEYLHILHNAKVVLCEDGIAYKDFTPKELRQLNAIWDKLKLFTED